MSYETFISGENGTWNTTASTGVNRSSISNCPQHLQDLGIVRKLTGYRRNRVFVYHSYLDLLNEGTREPLY